MKKESNVVFELNNDKKTGTSQSTFRIRIRWVPLLFQNILLVEVSIIKLILAKNEKLLKLKRKKLTKKFKKSTINETQNSLKMSLTWQKILHLWFMRRLMLKILEFNQTDKFIKSILPLDTVLEQIENKICEIKESELQNLFHHLPTS